MRFKKKKSYYDLVDFIGQESVSGSIPWIAEKEGSRYIPYEQLVSFSFLCSLVFNALDG